MKNKKFDKVDYDQVISYLEDYFASKGIVYRHDSSCRCSKCIRDREIASVEKEALIAGLIWGLLVSVVLIFLFTLVQI